MLCLGQDCSRQRERQEKIPEVGRCLGSLSRSVPHGLFTQIWFHFFGLSQLSLVSVICPQKLLFNFLRTSFELDFYKRQLEES